MIKDKPGDIRGFGSYNEIYEYVESETGKKINKKTLYHICHYRLNAVSRVPRPYNPEQNPEDVRIFRENSADDIKKRNLKRRNIKK